jgi:flagellar protein FliL
MTAVSELNGADVRSEEKAAPGRGRKVLVGLVALALVGAAAWWFVLRPSAGSEQPHPGEMLALESTQINLADNHYLKIGIALQLVEGAAEVDGSKALDATIDLFSGLDIAELSDAEARHALKRRLSSQLEERYDGDVMEVYFTEFVTQ